MHRRGWKWEQGETWGGCQVSAPGLPGRVGPPPAPGTGSWGGAHPQAPCLWTEFTKSLFPPMNLMAYMQFNLTNIY